ncbi:hypothetical protein [Mesorhizobium sp. M4B.F.Ca.ET.058.02.1.1]|uniref:hypothetical protein n=1 Tax=Mesorhizobium sp. M4B.F.Ca.ET.058.02.1.1 TaxID=2493675 RepID=UPI000F74E762|nr:hypothetical protein [Mesorhizobium sp. M4B.F.Ca.ET.058.02.1.1]AZO48064.1 hypothetical protein EJ073_09725 [Mesorhizobium sp. M4B.F.Ca.ET.058.02.1.1]TJX63937.1 MAG: hypothetical protein E5W21_11380 [Mesorhizobium sp.]
MPAKKPLDFELDTDFKALKQVEVEHDRMLTIKPVYKLIDLILMMSICAGMGFGAMALYDRALDRGPVICSVTAGTCP